MTLPGFSAQVLAKARELRARDLVHPDPQDGGGHAWWVQSLRLSGPRYLVQENARRDETGALVATWATCNCRHGAYAVTGARCSHIAAVLLGYLPGGGDDDV